MSFFDKFWAKSDGTTTLSMHTQHVMHAGRNLLMKLALTPEEVKYWGPKLHRCAVLHDLGKIHPEFQKRLEGIKGTSIRHEILSLWFCENYLDLPNEELFAIATHHKGICKSGVSGRLDKLTLTSHLQDHLTSAPDLFTREILTEWLKLMQLDLTIVDKDLNLQISKDRLKLLFTNYQEQVLPDYKDRQNLSFMRALLIAADHIGSARQEDNVPGYKSIALDDFQPKFENKPLPFRNFQERLQGVYTDVILHAPTGSGKTEAALSWVFANQKENARLFYLLPYTASINAMVKRLQNVYGKGIVTALHSKTVDFFYDQLEEEESNNENIKEVDYAQRELLVKSKKSLSKELFYPVKVATLHQILKTSLKGKGWELSLYDYKNALFIIDEFHTYDPLLTGMLLASVKLFKKLFDAKFFFMSATIPDFMLDIIVKEIFEGDYTKLIRPNSSEVSDREILDRKRHRLFCKRSISILEDISSIKELLSQGICVLIIVNNVKTAQKLYKEIGYKGSVKLLHSGFHRKDRTSIEKSITHKDKSERPQLLIATQAVEVSLDIDYDVAFIEKAPIDALIQRFGRVNRAGRKGLAPIYLYESIIGKTPFYDDDVLERTWKTLEKLDTQEISEQDLTDVCNKVYENGYNSIQQKDFLQGLNNSIINCFETDWIAGEWNNWVEDLFDNNNQKVEVLCGNLVEEFDLLRSQKRYIEANQLLVSVYFYELKGTSINKDDKDKRNVIVAYALEYNSEIGYVKKSFDIEDTFL